MTFQELEKKVERTAFPTRAFNYDCSEYAEDAQLILGTGRLFTFKSAPFTMFHIEERGHLSQPYEYHTVLRVKCDDTDAVVDLTNRQKVWELNKYREMLQQLNPNTKFTEQYE